MNSCFIAPLPVSIQPPTNASSKTGWSSSCTSSVSRDANGSKPQPAQPEKSQTLSRRSLLYLAATAAVSNLLPSSHIRGVQAEALKSEIDYVFDAQSGSFIPPSALDGLLQRDSKSLFDRCIVAGEVHNNERTHEVQLAVIDSARRIRDERPLTVGFEQFYRSHTKHLNAYVNGDISLDTMLERTDWANTWGFDSELYKPIFEYCRAYRIPMCGLNMPSSVASVVGRLGLSGLPENWKQFMPDDMDFSNHDHYNHFVKLVRKSHNVGHSPEADAQLQRYYEVQVLWEEWMSQSVAHSLKMDPNFRMVALMGSGHVEGRFGFPDRLQRRCNERPYTIVPRLVEWTDDNGYAMPKIASPDVGVADLLWYTRAI